MPHPPRLRRAGAAKGAKLNLLDAVAGNGSIVLHVQHFLAAHVAQVVVRHQGDGVPVFATAAAVGKAPADDVGLGVGVHRVAGHVGHGHGSACGPVHHAAKDAAQVLQYAVGIAALLQVGIAGKARLLPSTAIVN